ncbi:hypothetical protein CDD82_7193 [Ophiocordyceps australis]|uniref:Nuclease S1 n=1 Tax=Ophiocordyceps australis TaxID=1399860 RepID=A0A2C5ZJ85_9HYPO|nr:hypothetical protein CDD82_7193 [Ophiocordyceps australis]
MKITLGVINLALVSLPGALGWGTLGHMTTAYLASSLVSNTTEAHFQQVLQSQQDDYLAHVASWADSVRYTKWGAFTKTFHFIDAHDDPPAQCNVDLERDCKQTGCVINALANYTQQSLDPGLSALLRAQAAKFVIHFVGDLHQPMHNEGVAQGGNGIHVLWEGKSFNLHHVWDSSIAEKWIGGLRGSPQNLAKKWAEDLAGEISKGKYASEKETWLKDMNINDANGTALAWSREANALVCTYVLPQGPKAIQDQELCGDYYSRAGPVVERQIARAGYRMAAWLDSIADVLSKYSNERQMSEEL